MYQDSGDDHEIYQRKLQELRKMFDNDVIDSDEYDRLKEELRLQTRSRLGLSSSDWKVPERKSTDTEFLSAYDLEMRRIFAISEIKLSDTPIDLITLDDK